MGVGKGLLKAIVRIGSGTLIAIVVGLAVELGLDQTTMLGGGIAAAIGTGVVALVGHAAAKVNVTAVPPKP